MLVTGDVCQEIHQLTRGTLSHFELYDKLSRDVTIMTLKKRQAAVARRQQIAGGMDQTPSRETEAESAKCEAHCPRYITGVTPICGSVHSSHIRYNDIIKRSQAPQATPHTLGTYPVFCDIESTGCQGHKLTLLELESFKAFVERASPRDLKDLYISFMVPVHTMLWVVFEGIFTRDHSSSRGVLLLVLLMNKEAEMHEDYTSTDCRTTLPNDLEQSTQA